MSTTYSTVTSSTSATLLYNSHENSDPNIISDQTSTSDKKSCDSSQLNSSWICSNAQKKHSVCVRNCENGGYERTKCVCYRNNCSWIRQDFECDDEASLGKSTGISNGSNTTDFLRSFIESLKFINKGEIFVNFQLR